MTTLEPCRRRTEDEVGSALYVAVLEQDARAADTCIDGVLIAEQAAADELQMVTLGVKGNGLTQFCGIVLDGDIAEGDVVTLHLDGVCAEGAHALARLREIDVSMVVVGDDGLCSILAENLDMGKPWGQDEFLLVGALLYEDYFVVLHEGTAYLNGLANGAELARAVTCHDDGVGIVVTLSCREGVGQEGE